MHKSRVQAYPILLFSLILSLGVAALVSCGGSSQPTAATSGTVSTFLSDPPTCTGSFSDVYVTVTKVQANLSATAGPTDSGWQTLIDLTSSPMQVDLMKLNPSATANFCGTLFMLGQKVLPPGKYQQIRLILLANNAASGPSNNACTTGGFNCVIPANSTTPQELQLSSQAQTGIKIPSSQITNGGLTVTAGQSVDLNIDFNSCASVVQGGNTGQYLLKPVLHAGEVTLNTNTISGKVIEGSNAPNPGTPVPGAIVLLEQPDPNDATIDRVIMSGMTQQDGTFAFCPLPPSTSSNFDVVVAGQTTQTVALLTTTTTYNPSVVFNVPVGGGTGNIPLFAETGTPPAGPATISGQILTSDGGSGVTGGVEVSALQSVTNPSNSSTINVTVPVVGAASTPAGNLTDSQPPIYTTVTTMPAAGCATSSADCVGYSLLVPASDAATGVYSSSTGNNVVAPSSTNTAAYTINALADGSSSALMTCTSPSGSQTSSSVNVTPGSTIDQSGETTLKFTFSGCTAP